MSAERIRFLATSVNPMGCYAAVGLLDRDAVHYSRFINVNERSGRELLGILREPKISELVTKGFLAKFEIRDSDTEAPQSLDSITHRIDVEALPYSFHATNVQFRVNLENLSYFTRKKVALAWLDINFDLAKCSMSLIDAHLANFALDYSLSPKWIDFGSLSRLVNAADGLIEFRYAQARPLVAMKLSGELAPYLRRSTKVSASGLRALTHTPTMSLKGVELSSALVVYAHRVSGGGVKFSFLRNLLLTFSRLLILGGSLGPKSFWSDYRRGKPYCLEPANSRESLVLKITSSLNFRSVADLGGNDGRFLWLVSRGRDVRGTLYDTDDRAVSKFCRHVFMQNSANVEGNSAELAGFVMSVEEVQNKHDLVLALAITHHLALGQIWGFSRIAKHFAHLALKHLLVEFMPGGVGALPEWYSLDNFMTALREEFSQVKVIEDSIGTSRILILATK